MLLGLAVIGCIWALIALLPLKSFEVVTLVVDKATGFTEIARPLIEGGPISEREAVTQANIVRYIRARETYDPPALRDNFELASLLSGGVASKELQDLYSDANPKSPVRLWGVKGRTKVYVKSVIFLTNGWISNPKTPATAAVRFETTRTTERENIVEHWVANVRFRYTTEPMKNAWRFDNPLGFQTIEYRKDQETVSPGETTPPRPCGGEAMRRHLAIGGIVILAAALGAAGGALAERAPYAVPLDSRIRTVAFEKDNVVVVYGTIGVSTMIVLGDDERIATVAIGDSLAWQAVPDQSKRYLFIKPLDKTAVTNMNIVTNKRIYNLILRAGATSSRVVFKLRFSYPDEESSARLLSKAQAMAAWPNLKELQKNGNANFDYAYKGHIAAKPDAVFDDGVKTFFRFTGEVPAIFVVNLDKTETLANYRREGQFIVVDKVAGQFTMRNGPNTACVFNLRAVVEPRPITQMADVQPETQIQHVPEETGFFARLFGDSPQ